MLKVSFLLFFEFIKVGLFTFGGGFASLPFLYKMSETYNWFSIDELTQMLAISSLTPGPIGFNMSTYTGFKTCGYTGAIVAGVGLILPMILITTFVFYFYNKFEENKYVKSILYVLKPTSCALISFVGIKLIYNFVFKNTFSFNSINYKSLAILFIMFLLIPVFKRNPIKYMLIGAMISLLFYFFRI